MRKALFPFAFTLIELAISIMLIGILTTFAIVAFERIFEDADARALEGAMVAYQSTVIQGAQRLNISPANVEATMVIQALDPDDRLDWQVVAGDEVEVAVRSKTALDFSEARRLRFRVNACGDVCPVALTGFSAYELEANNTPCAIDTTTPTCNQLVPLD